MWVSFLWITMSPKLVGGQGKAMWAHCNGLNWAACTAASPSSQTWSGLIQIWCLIFYFSLFFLWVDNFDHFLSKMWKENGQNMSIQNMKGSGSMQIQMQKTPCSHHSPAVLFWPTSAAAAAFFLPLLFKLSPQKGEK